MAFFNIGMQHYPRYFDGTIDDVPIYTKALTLDEIHLNFSAPNPVTINKVTTAPLV